MYLTLICSFNNHPFLCYTEFKIFKKKLSCTPKYISQLYYDYCGRIDKIPRSYLQAITSSYVTQEQGSKI